MGCVNSTEVKDISSVNGDYCSPATVATETELKPSPLTFVPPSTELPSSIPSQIESLSEAEGKNLKYKPKFLFSFIVVGRSALIIPKNVFLFLDYLFVTFFDIYLYVPEEDIMPAVDELAALVARLEAAVTKLEAGGGSGSAESLSASVSAYDELLASLYKPFSGLSKKIGGDVATIGAMLDKAFAAQRDFLVMSSNSKKPGDQQLQLLLKPTSDIIAEIQSFREKSRRSEFFNHLSAISESIPALGWVTVAPTPAPFVKEMNDAGQFYTNR